MTQTWWTRLAGPGTLVAPALSDLGRCLYAAAVSPGGDVVTSKISTLSGDWSSWTVVGSAMGYAAVPAAIETSPVLCQDGDKRLLLVCRGVDDNLHVTSCRPGTSWEQWHRLTDDGSIEGGISATVTASPWRLHVTYSGPGHMLHYRSFDQAWSAKGAESWPDVREGVLASDGSSEVFSARRSLSDHVRFMRLDAPWDRSWEPVVTPAGQPTEYDCLSLSNAVHHAGAFHVLFVWQTRRVYHAIQHVRVRTRQYDDGYFAHVAAVGVTPHMPQVSLSTYRNRLVAAFSDATSDIRYAWLDDIDPSNRWIGHEIVASGKTTDRIALAECDFRPGANLDQPNFGHDLFALVRGSTGTFVYFINFSRAFFKHRLNSIGHRVEWCTKYPGTIGKCTSNNALPPIEELPIYSEIGAGTIGMPDRVMSEVFPRVMNHANQAGHAYMTWVHNEQLTNAYIGPHINVDARSSSDDWHHEMLHRLLTSLQVTDSGGQPVNPNLMRDYLSDSLVVDGAKLFGQFTNPARDCQLGMDGPRCRGFVNSGGINYDVQSLQHSFIGVIGWYLRGGQRLRDSAYSDLRVGVDLLWQKYHWVREHMFGGVEFGDQYEPIQVATIRNVRSGKVLDVRGWRLDDHAPLQQYTFHGGDNQRFHLWQLPEGYVQIVAMHSGKALDVVGGSTDNGAAVQQYSRSSSRNQQ